MVSRLTRQRQCTLAFLLAITIALTLIGCGKSGSDESSAGAGQTPTSSVAVANPRATFTADPNPATVSDGTKLGVTKLTWNTTATKSVEIHVGKPEGPLLCRGISTGSCDTGKWVTDGMIFFLQDSAGNVTDSSATLAAVRVQVK